MIDSFERRIRLSIYGIYSSIHLDPFDIRIHNHLILLCTRDSFPKGRPEPDCDPGRIRASERCCLTWIGMDGHRHTPRFGKHLLPETTSSGSSKYLAMLNWYVKIGIYLHDVGQSE